MKIKTMHISNNVRGFFFCASLFLLLILSAHFYFVSPQQENPPALPAPETFMVPMRDGVKLATDVSMDKTKCPCPVIVARTPYGRKNQSLGIPPDALLTKGYAVAVQDMRGRFDSGGVSVVFFDDGWGERQDGYDTIEWLAKQSWSNGKICSYGASALGISQNMMAGSVPPHLTCQVIMVAASSLYHQAAFQGGGFRKGLAEGWLKNNSFALNVLKQFEGNPDYNALWKQVDSETRHEMMTAPALHIGGWYDIFQAGTLNSFTGRQNHGGKGARGNQKLLMGPWTHGIGYQPMGDYKFPDAETHDTLMRDMIIKFLDYWLKGDDNGIMKEPAVTYYLMGDLEEKGAWNAWKTADAWPPVKTQTKTFYIHDNAAMSDATPQTEEKTETFTFDSANPVPTYGGNNLNPIREGFIGPKDQRPVENRKDVLLYTTTPLDKPITVLGQMSFVVYASSTAKDTDFTAKLTDVYPDGKSVLIADGIVRARKREGIAKEVLMQPGKIYKFTIDLWSTAYVFNKGHAVRVALSSSNYPRFDVNPNTGGKFKLFNKKKDKFVSAAQTVYHTKKYPSALLLPLSP